MSLLSIYTRADPCVTNQCASYFCSCQPLGVLLMTPAIWRIRPYWPYDESPDGLSFLIPCGSKWVIGIPTRVIPVETTVATTVKFRPLFAILVNLYVSSYTRIRNASAYAQWGDIEVGWRVRPMVNHGRVESERAEVVDTIRHLQFYNYLQPEGDFNINCLFSWLPKDLIWLWPKLDGITVLFN